MDTWDRYVICALLYSFALPRKVSTENVIRLVFLCALSFVPLVYTRAPRSHSRRKTFTKGEIADLYSFSFVSSSLAASSFLLSLIINRWTISISPFPLRLPPSGPVSSFLVLFLSHGSRCRADSWRMAARINSPGAIRTPPRSYLINVIRGLMDDCRREAAASCFRRA